jgi:alcohol dehydrogenase (cytochrome c)
VGERQYIAVSVGQAVNTGAYLLLAPELKPSNHSALYIFALPQGWQTARAAPQPGAAPAMTSAAQPAVASGGPAAICRKPDAQSPVAAATAFSLSPALVQQGKSLYTAQQCATCHGENLRGSPGGPALADAGFRSAWAGRSVQALLDCTRNTMPPGRAGTLSEAEYLSLLALILDANGHVLSDRSTGLNFR